MIRQSAIADMDREIFDKIWRQVRQDRLDSGYIEVGE